MNIVSVNNALVTNFLNVCKVERNLSQRTIKAYKSDLACFQAYLAEKELTGVDLGDLRGYLGELEDRSLAGATVRRRIATLKALFSHLEEEKIIGVAPTQSLRHSYKMPKKLPKVMSDRDIQGLLLSAYTALSDLSENVQAPLKRHKRLRDRAMLEVLFSTGIRIDELVKLDVQDTDLGRRTLLIKGKGRKERLLYLSSDEVVSSICEYLTVRNIMNPVTKGLWLNRFGKRLSVHSVGVIFREYGELAGIDQRYTPHCLRHTMATMLLENGADVRSVQEILGHSRISTTEIYLEVSKRRKAEVLRRFNQRNRFSLR